MEISNETYLQLAKGLWEYVDGSALFLVMNLTNDDDDEIACADNVSQIEITGNK